METLSIVLQGPVRHNNEICPTTWAYIMRTRNTFPQAEVIVSTWKESAEQDGILSERLKNENIKLVLSDDPGALIMEDQGGKYVNNVNRLLLSSRRGVEAATRNLTVKLRTDCYLHSRNLIRLLSSKVLSLDGITRDPHFSVFKSRVINASWFARDARGSLPYLFHPGDILLAGKTEDLLTFFSAPPLSLEEAFKPSHQLGMWCAWRYVPEQYFWTHAIRAVTGKHVFNGNFKTSEDLVRQSEQYYLANFVPYSARQLGFSWPKYWYCYPLRGLFSVYTNRRWLRIHKKYKEGKAPISVLSILDALGTWIWKAGYLLRAQIVRIPLVRRILITIFLRRK